jgi:hypothetical protein
MGLKQNDPGTILGPLISCIGAFFKLSVNGGTVHASMVFFVLLFSIFLMVYKIFNQAFTAYDNA